MRKTDKFDWFVFTAVFAAVTVSVAAVSWDSLTRPAGETTFAPSMSIRAIGKANDVPPKEILHTLSHEDRAAWDWPRDVPVSQWPIESERVREAVEHAAAEITPAKDCAKVALWAVWICACTGVLVTSKRIRRRRFYIIAGAVLVFGILLGATPNPMEGAVKFFKWTNGMEGRGPEKIVFLAAFLLMAVVFGKAICGWGCHLGTLQELLYGSHLSPRGLRWKPPFWLSNGVRAAVFVVFVFLLYGLAGAIKDFVLYHHINFFKIFNADLAPFAYGGLAVFLAAAILLYRPFCQFVCPFGFLSWLLERLSFYKVRIDRARCTQCLACVKACPTFAMKGRLDGKRSSLLPECWTCGACVESCGQDALVFDRKLDSTPAGTPATDQSEVSEEP